MFAVHSLTCEDDSHSSTSGIQRSCLLPRGATRAEHKLCSVVAGRSCFMVCLCSCKVAQQGAHVPKTCACYPGVCDSGETASTVLVVRPSVYTEQSDGVGPWEGDLDCETHTFDSIIISSAAGGSHYLVASDSGVPPIAVVLTVLLHIPK